MPKKVSRSNSNPAKCWLRLVPKLTAVSKQVVVPNMQSRISRGKLNPTPSFACAVSCCAYVGVGFSCGLQGKRSCKPSSGMKLFEMIVPESSLASCGQTGKEGMFVFFNAGLASIFNSAKNLSRV